jgi:SP family sugar:H+ symporter-like MFS transporter
LETVLCITTPAAPRLHFGFILLISGVAALGGFLFGYESGYINGTITALQKAFNSSSLGSGLNVTSMLLGCAKPRAAPSRKCS